MQKISHAAKEIQRISQLTRDNSHRDDNPFHLQLQASSVSDETLGAMQKLAGDIVRHVDRFDCSESEAVQAKGVSSRARRPSNSRVQTSWKKSSRPMSRKNEPCCSMCGCLDTPQWRSGPQGPATLCNVCGLLYSRRKLRRRAETEMLSVAVSS
ncbi:white collar-2 [Colletotrichum truncatum]|uniref:White collar-2 n=1 Tax=Colletotrichum truncatum TaxID=5467 RepID=A0ACC3YE27_COLTU|nr:white collar-2 [Colletotrichum truncatum]KAF6790201.1 white collar-2 [Colletotrichum truncatum]